MRWHVPSWTGDVELRDEVDHCVLVLENCTWDEWARATAFLNAMGHAGFYKHPKGRTPAHPPRGRREYRLNGTVMQCSPAFVAAFSPRGVSLTVVTAAEEVIALPDAPKSATPAEKAEHVAKEAKKVVKDNPDVAATTVRKPTKCCPLPIEGPLVRSERVLGLFSSPRQREEWVRYGYLTAIGGVTGTPYRVYHRNHRDAQRFGFAVVDLDARAVIHGHVSTCPPAEEVLTLKLALEHREWWLRSCGAALAHHPDALLDDKDGVGGMEGTGDAQLSESAGLGVLLGGAVAALMLS